MGPRGYYPRVAVAVSTLALALHCSCNVQEHADRQLWIAFYHQRPELSCSELVVFGRTIIDTSQLLPPPIPSIGTSKHGDFLLTWKFSIVDFRQSAAVLRQ